MFTKEGTLGSIYLDGELLGTGTVSGDVTSTAETLGFGQDRSFKGLLDEIALYNFGLTASDVAEHYARALEGFIPGDANGDGAVDDKDASILGSHWLRSGDATWADGDFNNDGAVNDADAAILAAHWGQGSEGSANVPEPSVAVVLISALIAVLFWSRSHGRLEYSRF